MITIIVIYSRVGQINSLQNGDEIKEVLMDIRGGKVRPTNMPKTNLRKLRKKHCYPDKKSKH